MDGLREADLTRCVMGPLRGQGHLNTATQPAPVQFTVQLPTQIGDLQAGVVGDGQPVAAAAARSLGMKRCAGQAKAHAFVVVLLPVVVAVVAEVNPVPLDAEVFRAVAKSVIAGVG